MILKFAKDWWIRQDSHRKQVDVQIRRVYLQRNPLCARMWAGCRGPLRLCKNPGVEEVVLLAPQIQKNREGHWLQKPGREELYGEDHLEKRSDG